MKESFAAGRIRPFVLALVLLVAGLLFDQWWWQIGVIMIVVIFLEAYYRYTAMR